MFKHVLETFAIFNKQPEKPMTEEEIIWQKKYGALYDFDSDISSEEDKEAIKIVRKFTLQKEQRIDDID